MVEGWSEVRKDCSTQLHDYWNFREELSVENQLLYKVDCVVIPKTLQPEILRCLPEGHMGIEKMLLHARPSIFWPGLTADVTNIAKNCQVCQKYAPKQSQEPILVHEPTATRRGSKLYSRRYSAAYTKAICALRGCYSSQTTDSVKYCVQTMVLLTYQKNSLHSSMIVPFDTSLVTQCTLSPMVLLNPW